MMSRHQRARAFADKYREALETRACEQAVMHLGRSLTRDEHRIVCLAVLTFLPEAGAEACETRYALTDCGRRELVRPMGVPDVDGA
jgi:hypothetical protein